ncbi:MAG: Hsp20/alpha crystallin family protein [Desulfatibacillaceae bacterium]|nr:Hsp20/alpha crystallin family protein [Desulfatibacillaceae bacterium]
MITRTFFPWSGTGNPLSQLERLSRQLDGLMGERGQLFGWAPVSGVFPLANVTESPDAFFVRAELPGLGADQIDISITGNTLSISGQRAIPDEEGASYHRRERKAGAFSRMITLPGDVDTEKVSARSVNGVLTVTLPKSEAAKPRQIKVKTA